MLVTRVCDNSSMPRAASASRNIRDTSPVTGTGPCIGNVDVSCTESRMPRRVKYSCRPQSTLERGRRALEGLPEHGDENPSAVELGQRVAQPVGAGDRVVLMAARLEAGRRVHVVVGAHRYDEEVRVVGIGVRGDLPALESMAVTVSWWNSTPTMSMLL